MPFYIAEIKGKAQKSCSYCQLNYIKILEKGSADDIQISSKQKKHLYFL